MIWQLYENGNLTKPYFGVVGEQEEIESKNKFFVAGNVVNSKGKRWEWDDSVTNHTWSLQLGNVTLDNNGSLSYFSPRANVTIFSSASPLTRLPANDYDKFTDILLEQMKGSSVTWHQEEDTKLYWTNDCTNENITLMPNLTFELSGSSWLLPNEHYLARDSSKYCLLDFYRDESL